MEYRRSHSYRRRAFVGTLRNFLVPLICLVCVGCTAITVYRMAHLESQFLSLEQKWRRFDALKASFLDILSEHQTVSFRKVLGADWLHSFHYCKHFRESIEALKLLRLPWL